MESILLPEAPHDPGAQPEETAFFNKPRRKTVYITDLKQRTRIWLGIVSTRECGETCTAAASRLKLPPRTLRRYQKDSKWNKSSIFFYRTREELRRKLKQQTSLLEQYKINNKRQRHEGPPLPPKKLDKKPPLPPKKPRIQRPEIPQLASAKPEIVVDERFPLLSTLDGFGTGSEAKFAVYKALGGGDAGTKPVPVPQDHPSFKRLVFFGIIQLDGTPSPALLKEIEETMRKDFPPFLYFNDKGQVCSQESELDPWQYINYTSSRKGFFEYEKIAQSFMLPPEEYELRVGSDSLSLFND